MHSFLARPAPPGHRGVSARPGADTYTRTGGSSTRRTTRTRTSSSGALRARTAVGEKIVTMRKSSYVLKRTKAALARMFIAPRRALAPFVPGARGRAERAAQALPSAYVYVDEPESTTFIVNANKKDVTKYLYQGGVSTVLTGGVMLGATPSPKAIPAYTAPQRYHAPASARAPRHAQNTLAATGSWRRVAVSA